MRVPDLPPWVAVRRGAVISPNGAPDPGADTSSEGQRIVQELDTSDEDAFPGRHRASASVARRTSVRIGIAALAVLLTVGLGAVTADLLGLSDAGQLAAGDPLGTIPPAVEEEPRAGRTVDLTSRPTSPPHPAPPDDLPAEPSPERAPAAATPAAEQPRSAPAAPPPPVRTVRTGDSCTTVGQAARTTRGDVAVCTASPGNGPNKWRAA